MTLQGTVVNGTIVFDEPVRSPEQARVEIIVKDATSEQKPTLLSLLKLAGTAKDLPENFAAQHDHYIRGISKR